MSMEQPESILDKVMENKQAENLNQFDPQAVLLELFSVLNDREREVLTRRFGLTGDKSQTLELIGKHFGVTRERVRQIETGSIKKLRKLEDLESSLKQVQSVIFQVLDQYGGILEENHLLDLVLAKYEDSLKHRAILLFMMEKLLHDHFDCLHKADEFHRSWKVATVENQEVKSLVDSLIQYVEEHGEPIEESDLLDRILNPEADHSEHKVKGHLRISKKLKQNIFDHWGKADWNSITPKRMNDKIHLVLKHVQKPMHFTDIAKKINELNFDHKTAYPATVHNELILDDNYVLVGRGIYALSDWGYQPGVVADVITRVLETADRPLSREEIVERVLDQRIVGKSTVHLALMNKDRFAKNDSGQYSLVA